MTIDATFQRRGPARLRAVLLRAAASRFPTLVLAWRLGEVKGLMHVLASRGSRRQIERWRTEFRDLADAGGDDQPAS